jgi:hypothetical protein
MKRLFVVALLAIGVGAGAQTSAGKKELIAKVLQMQQPAIEAMARGMAEQPALLILQGARNAIQSRVPPEKREAVAREIQADLKKYADEAVPFAQERAVRVAPTTVGALLDERFTEEELRQLVAIIENPVNRKFGQMAGEMQISLQRGLAAEIQGTLDPKIKSLELTVAGRLGIPVTAPAAAPSARQPAKAASK